MGRKEVVVVTDREFEFVIWVQIFYEEFDGCRKKRLLAKIQGD